MFQWNNVNVIAAAAERVVIFLSSFKLQENVNQF